MTRRAVALALVLLPATVQAHVGSPNVIFEGSAGAYPIRVIVRPPDVVPGLADVTVRLLEGTARRVTVQPHWWFAPKDGGAPPPDAAAPVKGEPALFTGSLWLMTGGSYAVRVSVEGDKGQGEVLVPVAALPARAQALHPAFGALLLVLAALLYAGSVSIVRAAVGEAVLAPGDAPGSRRRRSWIAASIAALAIGALLAGLWRWWGATDAAFRRGLYAPPRLTTAVQVDGGGRLLRLSIDQDRQRGRTPLTPDHGKLMHLFLVQEPGHAVLAHLHPVPVDKQESFEAPLPPFPGGRYRVFADITRESGLSETLTDAVTLPEPQSAGGGRAGDADDSFYVAKGSGGGAQPYPAAPSKPDGYAIRQQPQTGPLKAGREVSLRYTLQDQDGRPVLPEPYMGMAGHAVVLRDDGSVFVHLHPSGTISMASQQAFDTKFARAKDADHAAHATVADPMLAFPYAFPREGRYRVFVQAKAAGLVRTAAFDVTVEP